MQFVLLGPGSFRMGTPPEEQDREPQEVQHSVTLSAFYMSRYEVTQAEWERVTGHNPSQFQDCGARCPVENVNWFEVQQFIRQLNNESQSGFRLPTEAEWEFACRTGTTLPFGSSETLSSREANINGEFPYNALKGRFRGQPITVGQFPPNRWGLFDMSGNVWEWTSDDHSPGLKVIRGGSWRFGADSARCGLRYTHRPQDRGYSLGVRLAHD